MALLVSFFVIQPSPIYQQYGVLTSKGGTLADVGAVLVLLGVLLEWRSKGCDPFRLLRGRGMLPFLAVAAYFGWTIVTFLWSSAASSTLLGLLRSEAEAPILLLLAVLVLRDRARVRWAMTAYAVSALFLVAYVIRNFASLHGFTGGPLTATQLAAYRGGQTGFNYNELSIILSLVPALTYLAAEELGAGVRIGLTALTVPVVLLALIILTSREAFVALTVGIVCALIFARGGWARAGLGVLAAVGGIVFAVVSASGGLPYYFLQRFQMAGSDQLGGRGPVWNLALDLFQRHPMGLGAAAFEDLLPRANVLQYVWANSPHSDFIGTLVDYGLVGGFLLVAMLILLGREVIFRGGHRNPALITTFAILVTAMTSGSFLATHWYWTIMCLAFCYALTPLHRESQDVSKKVSPDTQNGNPPTGPRPRVYSGPAHLGKPATE